MSLMSSLSLKPGDVIIASTPMVSNEPWVVTEARVRVALTPHLPKGAKLAVVPEGTDFTILSGPSGADMAAASVDGCKELVAAGTMTYTPYTTHPGRFAEAMASCPTSGYMWSGTPVANPLPLAVDPAIAKAMGETKADMDFARKVMALPKELRRDTISGVGCDKQDEAKDECPAPAKPIPSPFFK